MTSRLSAFAAVFAVLATAVIALAAAGTQVHAQAGVKSIPVVQLETVVVIGKRIPAER